MTTKYPASTIDFIRDNYPEKGGEYCSKKLNMKLKAVRNLAWRNKISFNKVETFDLSPFLDIKTPEVAYVLGLLWADGYVRDRQVSIETLYNDLIEVKDIFLKTGLWKETSRQRLNRQKQMQLTVDNKKFATFLTNLDYITKSNLSADKVLSIIPDDLKHYWFRGLVDGDGCFYIHKKRKIYQFCVASSYDQDWTYFENLCKNLGIEYKIRRSKIINKHGKENSSSIIRFCGIPKIQKLINYFYANYPHDGIGFSRKYNKWLEIIDCDSRTHKSS